MGWGPEYWVVLIPREVVSTPFPSSRRMGGRRDGGPRRRARLVPPRLPILPSPDSFKDPSSSPVLVLFRPTSSSRASTWDQNPPRQTAYSRDHTGQDNQPQQWVAQAIQAP